jgi:hypothetical protein
MRTIRILGQVVMDMVLVIRDIEIIISKVSMEAEVEEAGMVLVVDDLIMEEAVLFLHRIPRPLLQVLEIRRVLSLEGLARLGILWFLDSKMGLRLMVTL